MIKSLFCTFSPHGVVQGVVVSGAKTHVDILHVTFVPETTLTGTQTSVEESNPLSVVVVGSDVSIVLELSVVVSVVEPVD